MVIFSGFYGKKKPTAKIILNDILKQNKEVVVLHISEYLYKEWERTFKSLNKMARVNNIQILFALRSKKECDDAIKRRTKISNGEVPTEVIDAALNNFKL